MRARKPSCPSPLNALVVAAVAVAFAVSGCGGGGGGGGADTSDDIFEPNDDFLFAYSLPAGERLSDLDADGGILTGVDNVDYYKTTELAGGDTLLVYCDFEAGDGDVDLAAYDHARTELPVSPVTAAGLAYMRVDVGTLPPGAQYYYFSVTLTGSTHSDYDLWYQNVPADETDAYEENNNRASQAYDVAEGSWLSDDNGWAVAHKAADADWYALSIAADGTLEVTCEFYHRLGDVDVYLVDESGDPIVAGESETDDEILSCAVAASETIYVNVIIKDDPSTDDFNAYDLHWQVIP